MTVWTGLAVHTAATYVGSVDEEELAEPGFRYHESAFKRAQEDWGFDNDDLERIILEDHFFQEVDQEVYGAPFGAIAYMAHGWTRTGMYLEVMFATPDYGGGYFVFHAMPSRENPRW